MNNPQKQIKNQKNPAYPCICGIFFVPLRTNLEKYTSMKRYILSMVVVCLCCMSAWAVVATPEVITLTQADGSTVSLKLVGDEYHSYYTLLDGTPVRLNKKGMWVEDASVAKPTASSRKARRIAQQKQFSASFPLAGSPHSIVIMVNFKDLKFKHSQTEFEAMLNESGYSQNGGVGSARDYFIACSDSVFSPLFDCYGPVELSKEYAYYDSRAAQMVVEACNKVKDELGIDFAQYDTNNDGRLDNVFVYYAGHNEAEGGPSASIWPHRSVVGTGDRIDGKLIYDYACTSELRGSAGNSMCGIGTFCHEFGHVLGLPDYYDTDDDTDQYTVGSWDIMASGSYNGNGKTPPTYTAGERFQLGWLTPVQLTDAGLYTLEPIESGTKQVYLIANGTHNLSWADASPNEYWLLENRQRVGWDRHSTSLPGTGLLIWHVDYNAGAWGQNSPNNNKPKRYDIEEAGGEKGYSSESDPYPGSKKVTTFTPLLHNGTIVEQPLTDIAQDGQNILFTFKSNGFMFLPTELPVIQSTYNSQTKEAVTPASKLRIAGESLDPEQEVTVTVSGTGFYISTDSIKWKSSLSLSVQSDSIMEQDIFIRYAPNKQVCEAQRGSITARQGSSTGTFAFYGISPRPVLITSPEVTSISDLTPTSFQIQWASQADAEEYYVTLYHMEEGRESTMESFEGFDEEATVSESGWSTSFYRTTTKAKEDGAVSMWFVNNNEWLISPVYPMPVVEMSMWLNAPATTDSEVGLIYLTGYSEAGVDTIDVIHVTKNTKKYTYSQQFEESKGYRRFKLEYTSIGGEGVCLDAFKTTFDHKIVYTYKGREWTVPAKEGTSFYAYDLLPNTEYFVRLQSEENKGCEEHLSALSDALVILTKEGEPVGSNHLTLAYDSINYNPATHVIYLPQSLTNGSINIYTPEGELIVSIPVISHQNVVALPEDKLHPGSVYLVKYLPKDKMTRKSPWIKVLYQ